MPEQTERAFLEFPLYLPFPCHHPFVNLQQVFLFLLEGLLGDRYTEKTCSVPHCNEEVYPIQFFQMCKGKALHSAHTPQQAEAIWQEPSSTVTFPPTQTIFPSGSPFFAEIILPFDTKFSSAQPQYALLVSTNVSKQASLNTY